MNTYDDHGEWLGTDDLAILFKRIKRLMKKQMGFTINIGYIKSENNGIRYVDDVKYKCIPINNGNLLVTALVFEHPEDSIYFDCDNREVTIQEFKKLLQECEKRIPENEIAPDENWRYQIEEI